ncbi:MAG: C-GCAxxG-C-C family protein [Proteobacteria bacterium]|nr:C-GCAxxG-C-C family protein [Pseudomonadota bacterium]MBU4296601.1 C-GCAxxG-C-C family protein [Pseudomonadota bacterium]
MLIGAGKVAVGAAILSVGAAELVTPAAATTTPPPTPWGYRKLDPAKTAAIAYENWYKNYCCYAVASSIIDQLREQIGGPYNNLPVEAFIFGHGGTVGWGTLCGTLMGAGIATSFAAGKKGEEVLNDVIAWYGDTQLPIFMPANPKATIKQVNASDSPLCHVSVGKWMKKEGVSLASAERKDRCARVAADVAFHTVTLLNKWADGNFEMENGSQSKEYGITAQNNCMECHGDNVPSPKI